MKKVYIGIDNGVTGTIGIVGDEIAPMLYKIPVKKEQDYTKAKKSVTRLDSSEFENILRSVQGNVTVVMERPMVNPKRFAATASALRCFEAELVIIEHLKLPHVYVDSKEWQRLLLPKGVKGAAELKSCSLDIGNRLFPQFKDVKHPDRDGILIAEYARKISI